MFSNTELEWLNLELAINESYNSLILSDMEQKLNNTLFSENAIRNVVDVATNKKFKKFWLNVWEKIKMLWNKFITKIDLLVRDKSGLVNKYRNDIEAADIHSMKFEEIYPYWNGANLLNKTKIPVFNPNNKRLMEALVDESTFIHEFFPYLGVSGNEDSLVESIKNKFRGSETPINLSGSSLKNKILGMTEFNMQYKSIKSQLQADYNNIEACVKAAIKKVDQMSVSESVLFTEDEEYNEIKRDTQKLKSNTDESLTSKNDLTDTGASKYINRYKVYTLTCQKILGIKQTILEERYVQNDRVFRKILKGTQSSNAGRLEAEQKRMGEKANIKDEKLEDSDYNKKSEPKFTSEFGSKDFNLKRVKELTSLRKKYVHELNRMGDHVKREKLVAGDSIYDSLARSASVLQKKISEIDNELFSMGVETTSTVKNTVKDIKNKVEKPKNIAKNIVKKKFLSK